MATDPNPARTVVTNALATSETMQYDRLQPTTYGAPDWSQLKPTKRPSYFANFPVSLSSWDCVEHRTDTTQSEDHFIRRDMSILPHLVSQMCWLVSPLDLKSLTGEVSIPRWDLNRFIKFVVYMTSGFPVQLNIALDDLQGVTDEAREEGFPLPSDVALENVDRLLRELYRISPRRFEVYPTPDGEIAIDAPGGHGRSVLLLCDSEGGALCLVNWSGDHRRARYSTADILPDGFVREALADLESESSQAW